MEFYSSILAFHIISFVSWMAMLFYLPRLYIYHVENIDNKGFTDVVKIQEEKLYKFIGVPALWATVISGSIMIGLNLDLFSSGGWLHAKLTLVAFLIGYHISLNHFRVQLLNNECKKSSKFFRIYNEVPTVLMIFIVILVVIKPF